MPEIDLKRLRKLRSNAEGLFSTLVSDLKPFRHEDPLSGFRRKPDSESAPDDVNVTTTRSCLMGLALSAKLVEFFGPESDKTVEATFSRLLAAPWMSSGLSENNAFSTTLIIRLFGFMVDAGVLPTTAGGLQMKANWETQLRFSNFDSLARRLTEQKDLFSSFLFQLFPRPVQEDLKLYVSSGEKKPKLKVQVSNELGRLIRTTSFYDAERFRDLAIGEAAKTLLSKELNGYLITQINRLLLHDSFAQEIFPLETRSLTDIAHEMTSDPNLTRFKINDYPPAAAVLYWFVDGIARAKIHLPPENWAFLCRFASEEFGRQRSLAVAKHAAMMDPVAMAMSACLCARLRTISKELELGTIKDHHAILPSTVELERAVIDLFAEQTASGIWPKYFPLFHYQDAGSNFCFTFELLEAILVEFGGRQNRLLTEELVISGLERAVACCDINRLRCSERLSPTDVLPYNGWNSGGNLETLQRGQPESWATAVVHMFLFELVDVLSRHIQQRLLERYSAARPTAKWKKLKDLVDIDIWLGKSTSLTTTLSDTIIDTFHLFRGEQAELLRKKPVKKKPLSALLFGPPGTSKTEIAKAVAKELNWPLVEIDPSHFLQDSFQNIYVQAERIFEDVMDLCGAVVLFDEMDALVQKRDGENAPDTESKFLTTYMLPKLAKLHDRGQLVFLMATNFQASFDDAIKRAGRFDFLLCMGPPKLESKCNSIHVFLEMDKPTPQTEAAGKVIFKWASSDPWIEGQLSLYTYGEFSSFIGGSEMMTSIQANLNGLTKAKFKALVKEDSKTVGLKMDDLTKLADIPKLLNWKRLQDLDAVDFNEDDVKKAELDVKLPAIKYVLERKQSKRQYAALAPKIEHPK